MESVKNQDYYKVVMKLLEEKKADEKMVVVSFFVALFSGIFFGIFFGSFFSSPVRLIFLLVSGMGGICCCGMFIGMLLNKKSLQS